MVKKQLISLLEKSNLPIAVGDILKKIPANKTTIYRELEQFVKQGIVSEVEFGDGKKRYELSREHHHHLVCRDCGNIEDIEIDENKLFKNINSQSNFLIENHNIEFFGKCRKCQ